MLFTLQRYEFFSKSQQKLKSGKIRDRCCLPYKGTNFSANHNFLMAGRYLCLMLFTLQRYEFFSKSQHIQNFNIIFARCCLPYKGTNFSANHNDSISALKEHFDVVYPTKVRIFQQITTRRRASVCLTRCCLPYKGTNFSANHNIMSIYIINKSDVVYPTKVRIFQQITT